MRVKGKSLNGVSDGRVIYLFFWTRSTLVLSLVPSSGIVVLAENPWLICWHWDIFVRWCCSAALPLYSQKLDEILPHVVVLLEHMTAGSSVSFVLSRFLESGPNCQVCSHSHRTLEALNERWIKVLVALRGGGGAKNELNALVVWSNDTIVSWWLLFTLSSSSEYKLQF